MNDQRSKKILFNKSTLVSLKAELLKKQEEVHEKKQLPQHKLENFKPPPATRGNEGDTAKDKKSFKDALMEVDAQELAACRRAKAALEKKAELYEHLSDGAGRSQLAARFLVDFNAKKQHDVPRRVPSPMPQLETLHEDLEDDSEWTEFTDCLGRTRRCLKADLELYVERDRQLMRTMNRDIPEGDKEAPSESDTQKSEKPVLVQKTNDYLQSLRDKWEQKETELLSKDQDVHYQDLLFDEARTHGVAYYAFSTDEERRRAQLAALAQRREETERLQREAAEARERRDALAAARLAAARARIRARAGLPPEDTKEKEKDFTTCLLEFLTIQKDEADAKAKEEEKKNREEKEKERQKLREAYVRDWDIGKEGVEGKVNKFREMTQEEYVEQQRAKRINEFGPPQASWSNMSDFLVDDTGSKIHDNKDPAPTKSWDDVRPKLKTPPPPFIGDIIEEKGLYFTTNKKTESNLKYGNFVKAHEPMSVINELAGEPEITKRKRKLNSNRAEVALLPPHCTHVPKTFPNRERAFDNMRQAHAHGAKYLKPRAAKTKWPQHLNNSFVKCVEPMPVLIELDEGQEQPTHKKMRIDTGSAEVAPPPTYDYYGPVPQHSKPVKPFGSDMMEAYAQGAKSLLSKRVDAKLPQQFLHRNYTKGRDEMPVIHEMDGNEADMDKPENPFESNISEAYAQGTKSLKPKGRNLQLPQHYDFTFD